jgi:lipopolysaccharide export system protein LptA
MRLPDGPGACRNPRGGLTVPLGGLAWLVTGTLIVAHLQVLSSHAQVPIPGRGKNFVAPVTDAQGNKSVLRGGGFKPLGNGMVELTDMQAETFRGQQKDMVVRAPQCVFDPKKNIATSPGALSIRTADDRFSIQGEGFRWQLGDSRLASRLSISNQVRSLVRKREFKEVTTQGTGGASARATTNAAPTRATATSTNDFIDIRADGFEHQGEAAVFRGNVHVHDSEGDLACGLLRVVFGTGTNRLERIEAEQDVVLVQGNTRVTAEKAVYTVSPDREVVEFKGHALWQDGDRQGSGELVGFDRRKRVLWSETNAYLKAPRRMLGQSGLLSAAVARGTDSGSSTNTGGFVEVFCDRVFMQLAPTNGPVQEIRAEKNVLILDADQDSRALGDLAVYKESTGLLELTGSPLFESERRLITGKVLRFNGQTMVFSAEPDAYVKLPLHSLSDLPILASAAHGAKPAAVRTNVFMEIWSKSFDYHTNLLRFAGEVRANLLEGDQAQGKLTCETLTIRFGQQVEGVLAENHVELEQYAAGQGPRKAARRVTCETLRATFSPNGHLEMAIAENGVTAEQEESAVGAAQPILTKVTAQTVTAWFSTVTNRLDRAVADKGVIVTREDRVMRAEQAMYHENSGLLKLTGHPTARMPEGQITEAESLVYDRSNARFIGRGKFKSEWKTPPRGTNFMNSSMLRTGTK